MTRTREESATDKLFLLYIVRGFSDGKTGGIRAAGILRIARAVNRTGKIFCGGRTFLCYDLMDLFTSGCTGNVGFGKIKLYAITNKGRELIGEMNGVTLKDVYGEKLRALDFYMKKETERTEKGR